jgi:cystathionine beta-lyase/cystathionine gamma-synthase
MKFESQVVHAGDRRRKPGMPIPSTTPIHLSTTYFYDSVAKLDRIFAHEEEGFSYSRYGNPTNEALETLLATLENGYGALATSSGMAALHLAFQAALLDRRRSIVAANSLYGSTVTMMDQLLCSFGVQVRYVDICDLEAVARAIHEAQPGCVFMESVSNPLVRVGRMEKIAQLTHQAGAVLIVDHTFATPMLFRPLDLGADIVVHSATKYLSGHGDVLGGAIISDQAHYEIIRSLARAAGPILGPFESYLTMRGIKTLAVRFERQCQNAKALAEWLSKHPRVERVYYCGNNDHPDRCAIEAQFTPGLYGALLSFEIKNADRATVMSFMDRLKMVVPGTSLGDVHTLVLYPAISSHRDLSPKMRERMGIRDNLVRISAGIEAVDDIIMDLDHALSAA